MAFANTKSPVVPVAPVIDAEKGIRISVHLEIGRRRDCTGWGICDFSISIDRITGNSFNASMYVDDYNKNLIVLEVDKAKGMSTSTYGKYFSGNNYILEDDSAIPADIVRALGLSGSKTLVAGSYRIIDRNGILSISIPVK